MARRFVSLVTSFALLGACDTITSDFGSLFESFNPPTPLKAAEWAVDTNDAENQRRGIALLAGAPWGGAEAYVKLYRLYVVDSPDPLVRAFAIRALGRHGDAIDAELLSKELTSEFRIVRLEAAKALQRLHDPMVADAIWKRLVDENEDSDIRLELAIALGQYPRDSVFQALVLALDQRELGVNLAALDALQELTGQDFGLDRDRWIAWKDATPDAFLTDERYLYPTFRRKKTFLDYLLFWVPLNFESPGVPVGTDASGPRRTYEGTEQPPADFQLPTIEKPEPVTPNDPDSNPARPANVKPAPTSQPTAP